MPCGHQNLVEEKHRPECNASLGFKGHAGVKKGSFRGKLLRNVVRPSNVANATEHYAAAGALVYTTKIMESVCVCVCVYVNSLKKVSPHQEKMAIPQKQTIRK